jgi:hypothetical protein
LDSWCSVGLNGLMSPAFKLSRSVRQGCPLAPFLYLSIADYLGYVLGGEGVEGIALPDLDHTVINQEFADDTNLYLVGTADNLNRTKDTLTVFAVAVGAKINWEKSHAIWASNEICNFTWGKADNIQWLVQGETTRYLGFAVGFKVNSEARFQAVFRTLKTKLTYWCTKKLCLGIRVLIANQVLLASVWYIASCWCPHMRSIDRVKALIRNYIWSSEDGERLCRAKVAWDSMILPMKLGSLKLLDPAMQMQALMAKLFIRGLMPWDAPKRCYFNTKSTHYIPNEAGFGPAIDILSSTPITSTAQAWTFGGPLGEHGPRSVMAHNSSSPRTRMKLQDR